MDHASKMKQLEDERRRHELMAIWPIANEQGCAIGHFQFAQAVGPIDRDKSVLKRGTQ
jgi:hypothetical protein